MSTVIPSNKPFQLPAAWSSSNGRTNLTAISTLAAQTNGATVIIPSDFYDDGVFLLANGGNFPINFSAQEGVMRAVGSPVDIPIVPLQPGMSALIFRRSGDLNGNGVQINYVMVAGNSGASPAGGYVYISGDAATDNSFRWGSAQDLASRATASLEQRVSGQWVQVIESNASGTTIAKSVTTGLGSFHLGQKHSIGSAGENIAILNEATVKAYYPAWQSIGVDGSNPSMPTARQHGASTVWEPRGAIGTSGSVDFRDVTSNTDGRMYTQTVFTSSEVYTGAITVSFAHYNGTSDGVVIMTMDRTVAVVAGGLVTVDYDYPLWLAANTQYSLSVYKPDGTYLKVRPAAVGGFPYRKTTYRAWSDIDIITPVSTIIDWYGDVYGLPVPIGYWPCDGTTINSPGSLIDGKVSPDLRQRVVAGASGSAAFKAGVKVGADLFNLSMPNLPNNNISMSTSYTPAGSLSTFTPTSGIPRSSNNSFSYSGFGGSSTLLAPTSGAPWTDASQTLTHSHIFTGTAATISVSGSINGGVAQTAVDMRQSTIYVTKLIKL